MTKTKTIAESQLFTCRVINHLELIKIIPTFARPKIKGLIYNTKNMKKKYFVPEVEVTRVAMESAILSNGENLNVRSYGEGSGETIDDFWS